MNRHALDDERFADWVDGRLDEVQRDRFEAELRVNSELRAAAEAYRSTVLAVRASLRDGDGMGPAFADRLMARIAAESRARRFRLVPLLCSSAAAVLLAGLWFAVREFRGSTPESSEVAASRESDRDAKLARGTSDSFYSDDADDASSSDSTARAPARYRESLPVEARRAGENRAELASESREGKDQGEPVDGLAAEVGNKAPSGQPARGDRGARSARPPSSEMPVGSSGEPLSPGAKVGEPDLSTSAALRLRAANDEFARTRPGDEDITALREQVERAKSAARSVGGVPTPDPAGDALRADDDLPASDPAFEPTLAYDFGRVAWSVEAPLVLLVELPDDAVPLGDPAPPTSGGSTFAIDPQRDGFTQGVVTGGGDEATLLAEARARGVALQFFAAPIGQLQTSSSNVIPPRLAPVQVQELVRPPLQLGSSAQPTADAESTEKQDQSASPQPAAKVKAPADQRTQAGSYRPLPGDQTFLLEGDPAQVSEYLMALAPQVRERSGTLAVQRAFDLVAVDDPAPIESTSTAEEETRESADAGRRTLANQEQLGRSEGTAAVRPGEESAFDQLRKKRPLVQTWIVLRRVSRPAPPAGPSSPGPVPTRRRDDR